MYLYVYPYFKLKVSVKGISVGEYRASAYPSGRLRKPGKVDRPEPGVKSLSGIMFGEFESQILIYSHSIKPSDQNWSYCVTLNLSNVV